MAVRILFHGSKKVVSLPVWWTIQKLATHSAGSAQLPPLSHTKLSLKEVTLKGSQQLSPLPHKHMKSHVITLDVAEGGTTVDEKTVLLMKTLKI